MSRREGRVPRRRVECGLGRARRAIAAGRGQSGGRLALYSRRPLRGTAAGAAGARAAVSSRVADARRRGRAVRAPRLVDQLDETHSPFAPPGLDTLPRSESVVSADAMEGGVRFRGTGAGVDWGISAYRDIGRFRSLRVDGDGLSARRPARWMAGGDIEAARRQLGGSLRRRRLHRRSVADSRRGSRRSCAPLRSRAASAPTGAWATTRSSSTRSTTISPRIRGSIAQRDCAVRRFHARLAQATSTLRLFGLWNATATPDLAALIWDQELVENLRLDVSGGVFWGDGGSALQSFDDADFVTAKIRVYF